MSQRTSVFVLVLSSLTSTAFSGGTTLNLREVFIGRCWEYQNMREQNTYSELKTNVNCTELWTAFYNSFAYKDPCDVNNNSYREFFKLLETEKKITNTLLWSGSYDLIHDFVFLNDDYIVLEDLMVGYLMNELTWCGSTTSPDGLNYTHCNKDCDPTYPAWAIASAQFAERASGKAHVILNSSRSEDRAAYNNKSFFRTIEMPRLRVEELQVLVVRNIGKRKRETCGTGSLLELEQDAKRQNIKYYCTDQPRLVYRVFCLKFPRAAQCKGRNVSDGSGFIREELNEEIILWRNLCFILIAVSAFLLVLIGICMIQKKLYTKKTRNRYFHKLSFSTRPILNSEDCENNNV